MATFDGEERFKFLLTRLLRGVTWQFFARYQHMTHFYSHASCEA